MTVTAAERKGLGAAKLVEFPRLAAIFIAMEASLAEPAVQSGETIVEWRVEPGLTAYPDAVAAMEQRVAAIRDNAAPELIWLVEHPPLYTAGTSARQEDLLEPERFPVFKSGRGGEFTYHGPGQRVVYVMLDLKRRSPDLRRFVHDLEEWIIRSLASFSVTGERREGRVGIWVERRDPLVGGREDKVAAIGVRVRRWVTYHGLAINVEPDLSHFDGIVPCGIAEHGVTSLVDLGLPVGLADLDVALEASFENIFGPAQIVHPGALSTD